jgi:hypothetical protein
MASKIVEAITAAKRRVLSDGPVANKSFIVDASYQLKDQVSGQMPGYCQNKRFKGGTHLFQGKS